jgi:hypothetical protein
MIEISCHDGPWALELMGNGGSSLGGLCMSEVECGGGRSTCSPCESPRSVFEPFASCIERFASPAFHKLFATAGVVRT